MPALYSWDTMVSLVVSTKHVGTTLLIAGEGGGERVQQCIVLGGNAIQQHALKNV